MTKTEKNQIEQEGNGSKDEYDPLRHDIDYDLQPLAEEVFMTDEEEMLFICGNVIAAYKQLIGSDQTDLQKLSREMTKPFVTASSIVTRLNRVKK